MQAAAWVVPIIALVVLILNHLLRGVEQNKKPPVGRPQGERSKEPLTDLDRFLREVNRRRQLAEQRKTGAAPQAAPLVAQPVPERSPPPRRPQPAARKSPRSSPRRSATPAPLEPEPMVALPANDTGRAITAALATSVVPVVSPYVPPAVATPLPATLAKPAPAPRRAVAVSIAPSPLLTLLSSPENLRAAIVLTEIFEPPLSRRKR